MENKCTSFAYEEERSTYAEGERSKRSSILKPPKARAPLQEVNLGGSADDETGDFDTLRKRRVSFAGVNSVKEFCSNAESAQVCHIQSYEETFSTSSDNSHNSSVAKSQPGTPKNVSTTEDKNFVDDPMELTDSVIDSNLTGPDRPANVVRVQPILTANAQTESSLMRNPQGQSWNARKSALEHEEGQSWNARNRKPEELSSQWSYSMEMTEPLLQKRTSHLIGTPFHFGRIPSKSDSGMELTQAGGNIPNLVEDNLGDVSMEITDVIRSRKSITSSINKCASMEFTEVVQKNAFNFVPSPFSMELTEPVMTHQGPVARHSLFTTLEEGKPKPRVSYGTTPRRSTQSPGNKSCSDMEMTGVLSLSRASKLVANQDESDDDMDFTQLAMPRMPLKKKSRLSAEDEDDHFPIGHRLEADPADKENLKLPLVKLPFSIPGPGAEPVVESARTNAFQKHVEDDEDTLALNFNNVRRGNSPVELSFLKEFKESSPEPDEPVKSRADIFSSKKPLQYDVPDDHLLMFSLSTTEEVGSKAPVAAKPKAIEKHVFNFMNSLEAGEKYDTSSKPDPFTGSFLARPVANRSNVEPLRGVNKSATESDNLPSMRMSFKDFEIKSDLTTTIMMNKSLSTVGLDDSNILKAGFNDLSVEQVPACVSQLDINAETPRPSGPGNNTLARSMMKPHTPGLPGIVENSPICIEIPVAEPRALENVRDLREEDATHTSFSRPFYVAIPEQPTDKMSQSIPLLDMETTEVGVNQAASKSVSRKKQLPQACTMDLTENLNQNSVSSALPSIHVSTKHDCTDMELTASICTEETLLKKSSPAVQPAPSPGRPSSMDETNIVQPANEMPKILQPAQDSPVSISSEETLCKNTTIIPSIDNGSRDIGMDTEETFAKSKMIASSQNAKPPQSYRESQLFRGMSIEGIVPTESIDNHLINAGLNSTFSFPNFGSQGSTENILEPPRKSAPAHNIHDDSTQAGENVFAAHRSSEVENIQSADLVTCRDAKEMTVDIHPKSRIRISRKSNFFGNLENNDFSESKIEPQENAEVTSVKATELARKSAGFFAEVASHSRKSVNVVPAMNEESSDRSPSLPGRQSSPDHDALRQKKPEIPVVEDAYRQTLHVDKPAKENDPGVPRKSAKDPNSGFNEDDKDPGGCPETAGAQSVGAMAEFKTQPTSRKSINITPNVENEGQHDALLPSQPEDRTVDKNNVPYRKSVGFFDQVRQDSRKSIKATPNFVSEGSGTSVGRVERAIGDSDAFTRKPVCQEDERANQSGDFNIEKTLLEPSSESTFPRKSVGFFGQDDQGPRISVNRIPEFSRKSYVDRDVEDSCENHLNDEESMESPVELPKRKPRKSCIGVKMDSSSEIEEDNRSKIILDDVSGEFEFVIKGGKKKSVGVKSADAEADRESRNTEIVDSGIKVSTDDGQQGWSTDDDYKTSDSKPDHLSEGMMNVSIDDDDDNDFSDERMHVSTPCNPRLSSRLKGDEGRKRSLKADIKSTSDDCGVHDLSQDLMNVSLESDTRSPMLKKTCASAEVRHTSRPSSMMSSPAEKPALAGKSFLPSKSPPERFVRESQTPQKSLFQRAPPSCTLASGSAPSASSGISGAGMTESNYDSLWGLSHEIRVKNRDYMAAKLFTLRNRQIYEKWLFSEVIGLKVRFSYCELSEDTDIMSVDYTFREWKLKICKVPEDIYEFYKHRLLTALPEHQLKAECRKVGDLFRIAEALTKLKEKWAPLIERMNYLKWCYPFQINETSLQFKILDSRLRLHFCVKIDLQSPSPSEDSVSVTNIRGQAKEDFVKLIFRLLTPQKDMFYAFVKELRNNASKLAAR